MMAGRSDRAQSGTVAPELGPEARVVGAWQIAAGRALLVTRTARVLVGDDGTVTVDAMPGAPRAAVAQTLDGAVRDVCALKAGRFPLRGAVLSVRGIAVALIGLRRSEARDAVGELSRRGYAAFGDGQLVIDAEGRAWAVDAPSRPVDLMFRLRWLLPQGAAPEIVPMAPFEALVAVREALRAGELLSVLGAEPAFAKAAGRLVAASRFHEVRRSAGDDRWTALVDGQVAKRLGEECGA